MLRRAGPGDHRAIWAGMTEAATRDEADIAAIARGKHIVDVLIEERARKLIQSPFWPLYRSFLYPLLKEPQAKRMADVIVDMPGREAMDHVSSILKLHVTTSGLENVPAKGRVIIACVHPTGIADGVAMFDALRQKRPDMIFFANRDAIRVAPRLADLIIPVEWVMEKRTRQRSRETLIEAKRAFAEERCVVIFPSGRLAFMNEEKKLVEREWMTSTAIFARKHDCPVIPTHLRARNSWLYYWFWRLNTELRDITLFNELLNKRGKPFHFTFGAPIPPEALDGDPVEMTKALREHASHGVPLGKPWVPPQAG
jgi:putative hemolysin